ncbi:hypothetical protein [Bacillus sp. REN16]|uniref:hypothetical protein n=1 Tax=Bacillus sp. REN16 TaxID=2887296 RepID=UPI001E4EBE6D|nr:hypothetical protein [Bacillus sp. REN16]MCC3357970.1 hypothetical protein [Bacillus sp. REN16]
MAGIGTLLLPVIILFIIAVVFLTIFFGKKYTGAKSTKLLLGTYFIILTVSVIVYYCIPKSSLFSSESHTQNLTFEQIHQAIEQGKIEDVDAIKVKERWNLPYEQEKLNVQYMENNNMSTYFDRKDNDDNTIEVIYYVANTNYKGYDFYEEIPLPDVSIRGDYLSVNPVMDHDAKLYSFHNDFVISQFKGGGITEEFDNRPDDDKPLNYEFLIIRVPKNLELTGSEFVIFLEE